MIIGFGIGSGLGVSFGFIIMRGSHLAFFMITGFTSAFSIVIGLDLGIFII
jgi:hypothetical protein